MEKVLAVLTLFLFFSGSVSAAELTVAAAANARFAVEEIARSFQMETGIKVNQVFSSSGKLYSQLKAGAAYDLFISADMEYPEKLYEEKQAASLPRLYAYGMLVLWSMGDVDVAKGIGVLAAPGVKKIAIANPDTAPYGAAAVAAMQKGGLYETLKPKLVSGESIAQVNHFVVSRAADIGITAKSSVFSGGMAGRGKWADIDPALYPAIAQGLVVTKHGAAFTGGAAEKLAAYILSSKGKGILKRYGYRVE